jgi:hypothetical protein
MQSVLDLPHPGWSRWEVTKYGTSLLIALQTGRSEAILFTKQRLTLGAWGILVLFGRRTKQAHCLPWNQTTTGHSARILEVCAKYMRHVKTRDQANIS